MLLLAAVAVCAGATPTAASARPEQTAGVRCAFGVCENPTRPRDPSDALGAVVDTGHGPDGRHVVVFAVMGHIRHPQQGVDTRGPIVFAGFVDHQQELLPESGYFTPGHAFPQQHPLPMSFNWSDGRWRLWGDIRLAHVTRITAVMSDGTRLPVTSASSKVLHGQTIFWLSGPGAEEGLPTRIDVTAPAGPVSCRVLDCGAYFP